MTNFPDRPTESSRRWALGLFVPVIASVFLSLLTVWMAQRDHEAEMEKSQRDYEAEMEKSQREHEIEIAKLTELQVTNALDRYAAEKLLPLEERIARSDAVRGEAEAAKVDSPLLQAKPSFKQTASVNDIREIDVDLVMSNAGLRPVHVNAIQIRVFEAAPTEESQAKIQETQQFARDMQELETLRYAKPEEFESRRKEIDAKHSLGCSHGELLALDSSSTDVNWRQLEHLDRTVLIGAVLPSESSISHHFKYLLTEYPAQHHRQWFRFWITVEPADPADHQTFEYVISGLPLAQRKSVTTNVVENYTVEQRIPDDIVGPQAPLVPLQVPRLQKVPGQLRLD